MEEQKISPPYLWVKRAYFQSMFLLKTLFLSAYTEHYNFRNLENMVEELSLETVLSLIKYIPLGS